VSSVHMLRSTPVYESSLIFQNQENVLVVVPHPPLKKKLGWRGAMRPSSPTSFLRVGGAPLQAREKARKDCPKIRDDGKNAASLQEVVNSNAILYAIGSGKETGDSAIRPNSSEARESKYNDTGAWF
jgi:hypothetical protein